MNHGALAPAPFVFDEAGITEPEPVTVVVAIGNLSPQKALAIHTEVQHLLDKHVPTRFRKDMVFHAMDFFNGKRFKGEFPLGARLALLEAVLRMPGRHKLSVSYSRVNRAADSKDANFPQGLSRCEWQQVRAYIQCIVEVNRQMQLHFPADSLARLVCEDGGGVRSSVNRAFAHIRNHPTHLPPALLRLDCSNVTPRTKIEGVSISLERILSTPRFVRKAQEPMLQLADACAFAVRRWLSKQDHGIELMQHMLGTMPESLENHTGPQSWGTWYPHLSPGFASTGSGAAPV